MASFVQTYTLSAQASGGVGPAASGSFVNVDFANKTSTVLSKNAFGVSSGALGDNSWAAIKNAAFQASAKAMDWPLWRINAISYSPSPASNIQPFIDNFYKCVSDVTQVTLVWGVNGSSASNLASNASAIANYFRSHPDPQGHVIEPMYWEPLNEVNQQIAIGTYVTYFNQMADALHAINPNYIVAGPVSNYGDTGALSGLISGSNSTRMGMMDFHNYLECSTITSNSNLGTQQGTGHSSEDDVLAFHNTAAGTYAANYPIFQGEWSVEGCSAGGFDDRAQDPGLGPVMAACWLLKAAYMVSNPYWAAVWDVCLDSQYGLIGGDLNFGNFSSIDAQGYFLSKAAQVMPGTMINGSGKGSGNASGGGATGGNGMVVNQGSTLYCWATANNAKMAVCLVNYGTGTINGQVALSHWPVNSTGTSAINLWQIGSNAPAGTLSQVNVTAGITNTVSIPGQSVVILYA
jgi:hypothetical protein